jgi:hypothetical protein
MFGTTALPPWIVPAGDSDLGLDALGELVRQELRRHGGELLSTADIVGSHEGYEGNRQPIIGAAGRLRAAGADWLHTATSLPEIPPKTQPGWIKGFQRAPLQPWEAYDKLSEQDVVRLLTGEWLLRAAELQRFCRLVLEKAPTHRIAVPACEFAQGEQLRAMAT